MRAGVIAQKVGMTRVFTDEGKHIPVTVLKLEGCQVVGQRTEEKNGYTAVQLGAGSVKVKNLTRAERGHFSKASVEPRRRLVEFRVSPENLIDVGAELQADHFVAGQYVDACGISIGKGFAGGMKRHNFAGAATMTHGTHEYKRHGGSIGTNLTPGRTLPNVKMAGQYGNTKVTTLRQKLVKVLDDEGIVLIEGAVPGSRNGIVTVRGTVKPKRVQA